MMRGLYTLLRYLLLPLALLRLLWRGIRAPGDRRRWLERLGIFEAPAGWGGLWVHAASVDEVEAVRPLIRQLMADHPGLPVMVTSSTPGGSARVRELPGDQVSHVYLPYDLPLALTGFLRRVRPRVLLVVETGIRPNLLHVCRRHGVYTLLANARLSAGSARRCARLGGLVRQTFGNIDRVAAQAADAERLRLLGVRADRLQVVGNIAFDIPIPAGLEKQAELLRSRWGGRPVWIAAGTHEAEDERLLFVQRQVLASFPNVLLVLVPQQAEGCERVAELCRRQHLTVARHSRPGDLGEQTQVYLGDTPGELPALLGSSDVAFIGGSLVETGGHKLLEAPAQGVAVCFGPHVSDLGSIGRILVDEGAARQVRDDAELVQQLLAWFGDAGARAEAGERGRQLVLANRGALQRLVALIPIP